MPFFDLYGKMQDDLWEESNVIHQRIVYSINTFGPVGVDGFRPAARLNRRPGREVAHVHPVHDRRNMARCFRLWNALLWDRPEQRLFLPAQHRSQRYGHFCACIVGSEITVSPAPSGTLMIDKACHVVGSITFGYCNPGRSCVNTWQMSVSLWRSVDGSRLTGTQVLTCPKCRSLENSAVTWVYPFEMVASQ
jgi:hypothetical protein